MLILALKIMLSHLKNYSKYFDGFTCLLSCERSLPFVLLVYNVLGHSCQIWDNLSFDDISRLKLGCIQVA